MGNILSSVLSFFNKRRSVGVRCAGLTPEGNPLPPIIHQVVPGTALKPGRLVVVGDTHGCHDELLLLLDKVQYDSKVDNLILVGDLVNKGPYSDKVVETAQRLNALCVRGNHDDAALAAYKQYQYGNPTPKTLKKYNYLQQYPKGFAEYLSSLPFSLQIPSYGIVVVHAGLVPGVSLLDQSLNDLYKMRDLRRDPTYGRWEALETHQEDSEPWASVWQGPEHVFFGHDAKRRLQQDQYATGLDSGCVYGGQLTACVLPALEQLEKDDIYCSRRQNRQALTLEHFQAELVSLQVEKTYVEPGGSGSDGSASEGPN